MPTSPFNTEIAEEIWQSRYRAPGDDSIHATWQRVARALAEPEGNRAGHWADRFGAILSDFRFLPGGRILANAGVGDGATLYNCFVMGPVEDSVHGIFRALEESALALQSGGGIGVDFSTLRPAGRPARRTGNIASGPVSFMQLWDQMCATLLSTSLRRGAMMATLRCDHPDIERFITAKREGGLTHFNLSVLVSEELLHAVDADADYPLLFPTDGANGETLLRDWPGHDRPVPCRVHRRVRARELWDAILRAAYGYAEPGVLFIDRIRQLDNLGYCERITATNPCGEIPLPPYGACNLGSLNLTRFVQRPFGAEANLDLDAIAATVTVAVRMLDNVIDASPYPLPALRSQAQASRRVGLGITGLADTLILLGQRYGSERSLATAQTVMACVCHAAYRASVELAREKGPFPLYRRDPYLASPFVRSLPQDIRDAIATHGIRNSHLIAIAPTGTISLLADNLSSGIEPLYQLRYQRRVRRADGAHAVLPLESHALRQWRALHGDAPLPDSFVDALHLAPEAHLLMQASLQPYVDNAISKTINVSADCPYERFAELYRQADRLGLKGCTVFRPNPVTGAVLTPESEPCCSVE